MKASPSSLLTFLLLLFLLLLFLLERSKVNPLVDGARPLRLLKSFHLFCLLLGLPLLRFLLQLILLSFSFFVVVVAPPSLSLCFSLSLSSWFCFIKTRPSLLKLVSLNLVYLIHFDYALKVVITFPVDYSI